jgi:hypothetical protein
MSDAPDVSTLDTATRGHHPDSPSSLQASEACPCFENEQRVETANSASAKGTLQHKAAETRDLSILDGDEGMIHAVQKCIAYEDRIIGYFKSQYGAAPLELKEQYLSVGNDIVLDQHGSRWVGITGGYPDSVFYLLTAGEAHIVDFKFGAVPVTPTKDNLQGMAYALGLFQYLGPRIKHVVVHFYAPYQNWSDEMQEEKYIHMFSREDIPAMELRIRTVIAQKHSKNAKPRAKVDLCIWCAKKGDCEANKAAVLPLEGKYEDLVCPDVVAPHKLALPSQFSAALKFANQVENWAKAVKARCRDVAVSEGMEVPGFTVVKRADRKVESVSAMKEAALKNGLSEQEFLETLDPSLTRLETAVKAKAPKGKGAAAIRQLTSDMEENGATSKGQPYYFLKEIKSPADKVLEVETTVSPTGLLT